MEIKLSLIMTGADRNDDMHRFFSSLIKSKIPSSYIIDLIFINQGSFDIKKYIGINKNILFKEIKTERISLSKARNIGITHSKGEIIGFPDDDCWYEEDLISKIIQYFDDNQNLSAICTNVYDPIKAKSYGNRPLNIKTKVTLRNIFTLPISVGIFIRRKSLDAAGCYFNENLGVGAKLGSGEETDLIYRIIKCNHIIEYQGFMRVYHPVPEYNESDIKKYYMYGLGFGYLNAKIIKEGGYGASIHFLNVSIRSILGYLLYLRNKTKREVYSKRFYGILKGFKMGFLDII